MGITMLEQHRNFPFQMSSIHFCIEQENDFQLEPKHPLIFLHYSSV